MRYAGQSISNTMEPKGEEPASKSWVHSTITPCRGFQGPKTQELQGRLSPRALKHNALTAPQSELHSRPIRRSSPNRSSVRPDSRGLRPRAASKAHPRVTSSFWSFPAGPPLPSPQHGARNILRAPRQEFEKDYKQRVQQTKTEP